MGGELGKLPAEAQRILTGKVYFPDLISAPFHHGLTIVFLVSAGLAFIAAFASLARGPRSTGASEGLPAGEGSGHAHTEADLVGVVPGGES
jgi:hypothetical protein